MALSNEKINLRLSAVDRTVESIETTSMWIIHHRDSAKQITDCWMESFSKSDSEGQIALFYLANDVCQKTRKKSDSQIILQSFAPFWIKAISFSRNNETVRNAVSRILDIFEKRQIYSKSQLADMRNALCESSELDDNTLLDFDTALLIKEIESNRKGEFVMERARVLLSRTDFNFKEKMKTRMKNREDGEKFKNEIELSSKKLLDFSNTLKSHEKRGRSLLELVESAKRFFNLQLRDVTVVEDAYQKFGAGIENVKEEIEEMLKTGVYPGASPPRDAPSPTANDDPFSAGVEEAFELMRRPKENNEVTDMDVEKDEEITTGSFNLKTNQTFAGFSETVLREISDAVGKEKLQKPSLVSRGSDPRLSEQSRLFAHIPVVTLSNSIVTAANKSSIPSTLGSAQGTSSLTVQTRSNFEQTNNFPHPSVVQMSSQLHTSLNNQLSFYSIQQNAQHLTQQAHLTHSAIVPPTIPQMSPHTPTDGVANLRLHAASPREISSSWPNSQQQNFAYAENMPSQAISPSALPASQQIKSNVIMGGFSSRSVPTFSGQTQSTSFEANPLIHEPNFRSDGMSNFPPDRSSFAGDEERGQSRASRESSEYYVRNDIDGRYYTGRTHPYDRNWRFPLDRPFERRNSRDGPRADSRQIYRHYTRERHYQ